MKFIEWKDDYLTNHRKMDAEHRKLIGLLNKLHNAIRKEDQDKIHELLDSFVAEKEKHFDSENYLMKTNQYKGYFSHKTEHDRAFNKLQIFVDNVKSGEAGCDIDFLVSMRTWFENHLELKDKKLATFLNDLK